MALFINTNVSSLRGQNALNRASVTNSIASQRLASGVRINSSRDDASGLKISTRLTTQISSLDSANRAVSDTISLLQVADGALDESVELLQKIRTLAVQAANGTNSAEDRQALQKQVTELSHELNRIGQKTTFGGKPILDGCRTSRNPNSLIPEATKVPPYSFAIQFGANQGDTMEIHGFSSAFTCKGLFSRCFHDPSALKDPASLSGVPRARTPGEVQTALNQKKGFLFSYIELIGNGGTYLDAEARFVVCEAKYAQDALGTIDAFLAELGSQKAEFGSYINRLESTIRTQSNTNVNQADARSRVRDTDFAKETATLTQSNIMMSASQSILAQANQQPSLALTLLKR